MNSINLTSPQQRLAALVALSVAVTPFVSGQENDLLLELYESRDSEPWQRLPISAEDIADGGLIAKRDIGTGARLFRMEIAPRLDPWEGPADPKPVEVASLPADTQRLASDLLGDMRNMTWADPDGDPDSDAPPGSDGAIASDTVLGRIAYPIYDPAIGDGTTPAYFEIPLVRAEAPADEGEPNPLLPGGPPTGGTAGCGLGFIRVSNSRMIEPIAAFATGGKSPVETLREAAGGVLVRPVLYNIGYLVGESPGGELVAALGNVPFNVDVEPFLQLLENGGAYSGSNGDEEEPSDFPGYEGEPQLFGSYGEFKQHYLDSPVRQFSRDRRAQLAARKWAVLVDGQLPEDETLGVNETRQLLPGQDVIAVLIDHNHRVASDIFPGDGVTVTGLEAGSTLLTADLSDGSQIEIIIQVIEPGGVVPRGHNCTRLAYKIEGSRGWFDTPKYSQYKNYSQLCRTGWSGCGPTAWAMFYGHWDRFGVPQAMGVPTRADSPLKHTDGVVLQCTDYLFSRMAPWCDAAWSGQALTWPWNQNNGIYWASHRGFNGYSRYTWGAPWGDRGARNFAVAALRSGRVAVTGVDGWRHYNLAVAYTQTVYLCAGYPYVGSDYIAFNNGWGDRYPAWHDADSVWWASDARLFRTN